MDASTLPGTSVARSRKCPANGTAKQRRFAPEQGPPVCIARTAPFISRSQGSITSVGNVLDADTAAWAVCFDCVGYPRKNENRRNSRNPVMTPIAAYGLSRIESRCRTELPTVNRRTSPTVTTRPATRSSRQVVIATMEVSVRSLLSTGKFVTVLLVRN